MRKKKSPKKKKFRVLLDSAFAKPESFPRLKKKTNLIHVVYNCGLPPQAEDKEIYQKAILEDRFVLTINFKHFQRLVKPEKPGIIGIESQLTNEEIDQIVTDFLSNKNPDELKGKAIKI